MAHTGMCMYYVRVVYIYSSTCYVYICSIYRVCLIYNIHLFRILRLMIENVRFLYRYKLHMPNMVFHFESHVSIAFNKI
jgi:hypothetical protein